MIVGLLGCEGVLGESGLEIWFKSRESWKKNNTIWFIKDRLSYLVYAWLKKFTFNKIRIQNTLLNYVKKKNNILEIMTWPL